MVLPTLFRYRLTVVNRGNGFSNCARGIAGPPMDDEPGICPKNGFGTDWNKAVPNWSCCTVSWFRFVSGMPMCVPFEPAYATSMVRSRASSCWIARFQLCVFLLNDSASTEKTPWNLAIQHELARDL